MDMQVYSVYFERATEHMQVYVHTYVCMYVRVSSCERARWFIGCSDMYMLFYINSS